MGPAVFISDVQLVRRGLYASKERVSTGQMFLPRLGVRLLSSMLLPLVSLFAPVRVVWGPNFPTARPLGAGGSLLLPFRSSSRPRGGGRPCRPPPSCHLPLPPPPALARSAPGFCGGLTPPLGSAIFARESGGAPTARPPNPPPPLPEFLIYLSYGHK